MPFHSLVNAINIKLPSYLLLWLSICFVFPPFVSMSYNQVNNTIIILKFCIIDHTR